ncbi:sodium/glutamate symporter [Halomonas dongshanensis]|uniref:Sodium:glutamate symporter n=1 Tax=Halomonas dongshanensis TaxID=2890835 RepID=A0ABT2EB42_9GAMM|nr:sodium/glutamate symporter [Halomonas dongshanensis]MCS2607852.1 hypothetical protein [Halomonas dongshanensis]
MNITLMNIINDAGIMAILFLLGVVLRARIQWVQKLFLPASIIAGLMGLIAGPNGFAWLPLSNNIAQYPGILITLIFASLALNTRRFNMGEMTRYAGSMWSYGAIGMVGMYGGGVLITLIALQPFWPDLPDGFGILLAAGFIGGHGSAAAIGSVFADNGWPEATSLGMTAATVGVLASIVGGMVIIRHSVQRGESSFIHGYDQLPVEMRTGLVPEDRRSSVNIETVSSMTIDPLLFHALLVLGVAAAAFWIQSAIIWLFDFAAPTFAIAFLFGLMVNAWLNRCDIKKYVSPPVLNHIGGCSTDVLVAFGIASINLSVARDYFVPLLILMIFGIVFSYLMLRFMAPRFYASYSFEKGIFGWGWFTGTVAMGIALLRIVDPKMQSKTLDEFGFAYVLSAPFEILIVTFSPLILLAGAGWLYVGASVLILVAILLVSHQLKWYRHGLSDVH